MFEKNMSIKNIENNLIITTTLFKRTKYNYNWQKLRYKLHWLKWSPHDNRNVQLAGYKVIMNGASGTRLERHRKRINSIRNTQNSPQRYLRCGNRYRLVVLYL